MLRTLARAAVRMPVGTARWQTGEPPRAPPGAEAMGDARVQQGWDPNQDYEKTHPFYDPFYSTALFEFEFEEGFIDSSQFMTGQERELLQNEKSQ